MIIIIDIYVIIIVKFDLFLNYYYFLIISLFDEVHLIYFHKF